MAHSGPDNVSRAGTKTTQTPASLAFSEKRRDGRYRFHIVQELEIYNSLCFSQQSTTHYVFLDNYGTKGVRRVI